MEGKKEEIHKRQRVSNRLTFSFQICVGLVPGLSFAVDFSGVSVEVLVLFHGLVAWTDPLLKLRNT